MNKTYAVSDLHGCLELWKQIDKFTDDNDIIYVLGDCGDRGPDSWETVKAVASNKKAIYLKGNHEEMLVNALREIIETGTSGWDYQLSVQNGGEATINDALNDPMCQNWINYLEKLPTYAEYLNKNNEHIVLSHAGFTMGFLDDKLVFPTDEELIWDREHFSDPEIKIKKNYYNVFGHTPTFCFTNDIGALYLKNNKIDIDNGSFASGYTCLLDLDTFDEHIFKTEKIGD